ncbi:MAG: hypothetical protein MSS55_07540 [Ruminococcus sp.]|nr:hypothetical protein [Ruminococcus sp.]
MRKHSNPEDAFGEPSRSDSKGKGIVFALIPMLLLLAGVGFRIARTAQKAERLISHHASTTVTTTAVTTPTKPARAAAKQVETEPATAAKTAAQDVRNGIYTSGDYEVGVDLPAGTYLAVYDGASADQLLVMQISSSSDPNDSDAVLTSQTFHPNQVYFQVIDGQFLHISWANFYDTEQVSITLEPFAHDGMYQVGKDIPAGTYQLELDKGEYVYPETAGYQIYSQMASPQPLPKSKGSYTDSITLQDGEYVQLDDCHFQQNAG